MKCSCVAQAEAGLLSRRGFCAEQPQKGARACSGVALVLLAVITWFESLVRVLCW